MAEETSSPKGETSPSLNIETQNQTPAKNLSTENSTALMASLSTADEELRTRNKGWDKGKGIEKDGDAALRREVEKSQAKIDEYEARDRAAKAEDHGKTPGAQSGQPKHARSKDPHPPRSTKVSQPGGIRGVMLYVANRDPRDNYFDPKPIKLPSDMRCHRCGRLNCGRWKEWVDEQMKSFVAEVTKSRRDDQPSDARTVRPAQADKTTGGMAERVHEKETPSRKKQSEPEQKQRKTVEQALVEASSDFLNWQTWRNTLRRIVSQEGRCGDPQILELNKVHEGDVVRLKEELRGLYEAYEAERWEGLLDRIHAFLDEGWRVEGEYNEKVMKLLGV
ncbi:hypothetical protein BKA64DRAFT_681832 [Cadophora sp. MPI-SDFR-AT-0126]|nr:hypothetical protein BKA64DRAFT_681832 [Leotiomycetes sp. MPI-SDFR-AT-0126]